MLAKTAPLYEPGDVIAGKYQVEALLGQGGMGAVFRARNIALDASVAIKVVRGAVDKPLLHERLLQEARAAAKLQHPNIVKVFDVGETADAEPFIVMELLLGQSLGALLLDEALERDGDRAQAVREVGELAVEEVVLRVELWLELGVEPEVDDEQVGELGDPLELRQVRGVQRRHRVGRELSNETVDHLAEDRVGAEISDRDVSARDHDRIRDVGEHVSGVVRERQRRLERIPSRLARDRPMFARGSGAGSSPHSRSGRGSSRSRPPSPSRRARPGSARSRRSCSR